MTPHGALITITRIITGIAKFEDVSSLDAYMASDEFARHFTLVLPNRRATVMRSYERAKAQCMQRKPVPLSGTRRAKWGEALIARLKASWERHKGNKDRVARELNITPGAAERAYIRYVADATVNGGAEKPPRIAQGGRFGSGPSLAPAGTSAVAESGAGQQ